MKITRVCIIPWHEQNITKDKLQAIFWYDKAANEGDTKAMFNLARMYIERGGSEMDYQQAMKWFQKAADSGDAKAMLNLADMYENGKGVPKDISQAVKWYEKAAVALQI